MNSSKAVLFSSAVNQTSFSLDCWQKTDLLCFASCNNLAIFNVKECRVVGVSPVGHKDYVTCVRCIKNKDCSSALYVLSTSSDGATILWRLKESKDGEVTIMFEVIATLAAKDNGAVNVADAVYLPNENSKIFVSVSGENHQITSWIIDLETGQANCHDSYTLRGRSLVLDIRLVCFHSLEYPIPICGGDDGKVKFIGSEPLANLPGHEDWVVSLDYTMDAKDIIIASASKDGLIRLWRISTDENPLIKNTPSSRQNSNNDDEDELKMKPFFISFPNKSNDKITFCCRLEAVLQSHEGLVSDLCWLDAHNSDIRNGSLLSCSKTEDRSVILWKNEHDKESETNLWIEQIRLGEVGGNREGFSCSKFVSNSNAIAAVSYQGGLHLWKNTDGSTWQPKLAVSGHFDQVTDLAWDRNGRFLLTTSKDQTTRLFSQWKDLKGNTLWHELARPQVHGYDMVCLTTLDHFRFCSGAEEKVIRGFSAPANFIRNFTQVTKCSADINLDDCIETEGASIPSLGLSNKAITLEEMNQQNQQKNHNQDILHSFKSLTLSEPPIEDQLMQGTLWPEVSKLYGHGNELLAITSTSDGLVLASACRARSKLDANILLWDSKTWQQIGSLSFHTLSITQMAFSYDDKYLLSVSRDRSWAIYNKNLNNQYEYMLSSTKKESHSRVIWSCCWIPNSYYFITGSRDKTVSIWSLDTKENTVNKMHTITLENDVTAVASIKYTENDVLIAIGEGDGTTSIISYNIVTKELKEKYMLSPCPKMTIRRLQFKPQFDFKQPLLLGSCSDDHSVWLYEINNS